ncbi:MAG: translation initiation factor IF-2, partial [Selenomonadales bacterium]
IRDSDTAALVATDFGIELEQKIAKTFEETLTDAAVQGSEEDVCERPPVVTIMGHVDHGKTSLLDAIRSTNVTAHEAGGITQHIGAYTVSHNGKTITFLDTPGHEAFTSMRARGAQVTDIAILVVAADDGVMPQTIEAINHATAAKVPIIVAINKMDKPTANPERVKQELTNHGILPEEWGGDAIIVPVSAVTGEGLSDLLEMILLVADVNQYKANPDKKARGTIVEARLDKGRGPVATVLVQNGTLRVGDTIVAGTTGGRVRAMMNAQGERVEEAGPSMPVEVLGFNDVPDAGDILYGTDDDKLGRQVVQERRDKIKADQLKARAKASLDDLFNQIKEGDIKELNLIVKADVQGSVEAVRQALEKLSNEEVRINVIHGAVGAIKESDVILASASNAIIIGFNVRPDAMATAAAEAEKVDMRMYRIIYNAIEDIENAMKGMLEPEFKEVVTGHAEVRTTFKVPGAGVIAGAYITDGKIQRNAGVRLLRDNIVIHEGTISSLKRFKDDVKEVAEGFECGIGINNYNDIKENDVIEAFVQEQVKR